MAMQKNDIIQSATDDAIKAAGEALRGGKLLALPTETVYGLAANAMDGRPVAKIFEVKGRPNFNPIIVHVADTQSAKKIGVFNKTAEKLAAAFWPGPFTMVLPLNPDAGIDPLVTAGLDTVAVRVPSHPIARAVLREAAIPIAAPSANLSGMISPTQVHHLDQKVLNNVAMALDGGAAECGLESTIVMPTRDKIIILRPGIITAMELERIARTPVDYGTPGSAIKAPGMLKRHYAPKVPLRMGATAPEGDEIMIGFGDVDGDMNLSPSGDLVEAAANLFSMLHEAEQSGKASIAIAPIPEMGLGAAINDRLGRASSTNELDG